MAGESQYWQQASGISVFSGHTHPGGVANENFTTTLAINPGLIYAAPYILTRSLTINALTFRAIATVAAATVQMGVYGVECLSIPLPTRILAQESGATLRGSTTAVAGNIGIISMPASTFAIGDRRMVWVAITATASLTIHGHQYHWAIFGYDANSASVPLGSIVTSWDGAVTLPNTFSTTVSVSLLPTPVLPMRIVA